MTAERDYSPEEWELILEGPINAGLMVSIAERGGTIREAFSIAKEYTEVRKQHGASELLDEIASTRPKVDRSRATSHEELKEHTLARLGEAVALLDRRATGEEAQQYREFVVAVAERVAAAKEEGDGSVSPAEQAAIGEIAAAVGLEAE